MPEDVLQTPEQEITRLRAEHQRHAMQLRQLSAMTEAITSAQAQDDIFAVISRHIPHIFTCDRASVTLFEQDRELLRTYVLSGETTAIPPGQTFAVQGTVIADVAQSRQVFITNLQPDGQTYEKRKLWQAGIRCVMSAPLISGGVAIGTLNVGSTQPDAYSNHDRQLIQQVTSLLASTLENRQLLQRTQTMLDDVSQRAKDLRLLNHMSGELNQVTDEQVIYDITARYTLDILETDRTSITMLDETGTTLYVQVLVGAGGDVPSGTQLPVAGTLVGRSVIERQPIHIADMLSGEQDSVRKRLSDNGLRASLSVPVIVGQNVLGTINVASLHANAYSYRDIDLLQQIAAFLGITLTNARHFRDMRAAMQQTEQASKAKSNFLAHMSHELRTPLNGILGYVQIMQQRRDLSVDLQESVSTIQNIGEYLLALIEDVLDLSRIEAEKLAIEPHPFHLHHLLHTLANVFGVQAKHRNLVLYAEIDPALPPVVYGDERRLRQVLVNLLGNAIKFTQQGRITLHARRSADGLHFQVQDTGVGIPADEQAHILQPFYQARSATHREGSGLGLSLCVRLLALMGSRLEISSTPEVGSTFSFVIDLPEADQPTDTPDAVPTGQVVGYHGPQSQYRILVADDQASNRQMLTELLTPLGFAVTQAIDGQEALHALQTQDFDLALLDVRMPRLDGLSVMRKIRQGEKGHDAHVPIVTVSASAFAEDRAASISAGADAFIAKPVKLPGLLSVLQMQLGLAWVYAAEDDAGSDNTSAYAQTAPDAATRAQLQESLRRGDVLALQQAAERLYADAPTRAFAQRLLTLIKGFQLHEIQALLDRQTEDKHNHD